MYNLYCDKTYKIKKNNKKNIVTNGLACIHLDKISGLEWVKYILTCSLTLTCYNFTNMSSRRMNECTTTYLAVIIIHLFIS